MAFSTIIAVLAFFIAMVALWLSSEMVKKIENQNEKFVRAHISTIREELREMDKMVHKANRAVKSQESTQSSLDSRLNDHTKSIEGLKDQIARLSTHLEELDGSIPQRYRTRVAKANPKSAVKQAAKPSIQ
ncbi:MAG: hypothetical protein OQK24_04710 [Magnetovibrio sp.]|nr:hypothetical protein [Magnetovibrio sp.]